MTKPSSEAIERVKAPRVSCRKQATGPTPAAPREGEWVETRNGTAALSEQAATWIASVLGLLDAERTLRGQEHDCLDAAEQKGLIVQ